jgi:hypothetical protein
MRKNTEYWITDFNKIKESDWILKLISINENKNLSKLKNVEDVSIFLSNQMLYQQIRTDIDSIIQKDPMTLIKELVQLREKIVEEQSYLNEFKIKINSSMFKKYFKGVEIPDLTFNNFGYIDWESDKITSIKESLASTRVTKFNNDIKNSITNKTDYQGMTDVQKDAFIQSIKSSTGWFTIDYKKHAIGSMVDILKLTVDLLCLQNNSSEFNNKEPVKFLADIFQLYLHEGTIKTLIEKEFFNKSQFIIPSWDKKDESINLEIIKINEGPDDDSLPTFLNKMLKKFSLSNESGSSETLVLILFNIFDNMLQNLEELYNQIYERTNLNPKINKIERTVINGSIKESIKSLRELVELQMKHFFGLQKDIKLMDDKSLYPSTTYSKGSSNIFRIVGGVNSISKKEKCSQDLFPIKLKVDKHNIQIDRDKTVDALINMFMNKTNISMGGIVMYNEISFINKNCEALHRYVDKIIKSKMLAVKRIDVEFNKMIKSIRLKHVQTLSKHIGTQFEKIISENNLLLKKAIFNEVSEDLLLKYNEYKMKELYILKELIENNKYIKKSDRRNVKTLKELVVIQKKLIIEYFSIQNTSYVFSLLLTNVYKAMQDSLSDKGANVTKVMPNKLIDNLVAKVKEINQKMDMNKRSLNTRNINNLEKKVKRGENISLNMSGGEGLFDWIKIDKSKMNKNNGYNTYLKKILDSDKLTDTEKSILIKKLFSKESVFKKKIKLNKLKKKTKPITRPLNKLKTNERLVIQNSVLNIDFWQDVEETLCGKKIFAPFYAPKKMMSYKGLFDIFYAPVEGELNKESKYILSLSKSSLLNKVPHDGFILVCSETSDLEQIDSWRLLKKSFIQELKDQSASFIRKKIYGIVKSEAQYIKNTYVWKNSILKEDKLLIQSICKMYHNKLSGCQIIISREELSNYI